jgi:ABC-type nitrate/sulfonate/bicarbonate transport system permease component
MAVSNVLDVVIGARRVWAPVGLLTFSGQFAAWFVPLLIITVWQAACSFGVLADSVLPSPAAVVAAGWHLTLSGDLPRNMEISLLSRVSP